MKITGVYVISDGKITSVPQDITIENGIITDIVPSYDAPAERLYATAGFIDEHTHGGYGHDFFEATQEAVDAVGKFHLDHGTTSFVAAAVATKLEDLDIQIGKIRNLKHTYSDLLGLHMEGPFISVKKKGAQPEENIKAAYEPGDGAGITRGLAQAGANGLYVADAILKA